MTEKPDKKRGRGRPKGGPKYEGHIEALAIRRIKQAAVELLKTGDTTQGLQERISACVALDRPDLLPETIGTLEAAWKMLSIVQRWYVVRIKRTRLRSIFIEAQISPPE